jgi:hypothetical protein
MKTSLATIYVLAALAAAPAAWAQSTAARPTPLQSLVNDAVAQLRLTYRHDPAEQERRYDAIGQAIAGWNKSARSSADSQRLNEWLFKSIHASMPGSSEAMPPAPEFSPRPAPAEEMPSPKASSNSATSTKPASRNESAASEPDEDNVPAVLTGQSATTAAPGGSQDGDPFRDDPLPEEHEK